MIRLDTFMITSRSRLLLVGCSAAALVLTGCGGSAKSGSSSSSSAASPSGASSAPSGASRAQFGKVQQCLKAAGVSLQGNLPSGVPSNLPSGVPTNLPSGLPNGAAGGNGLFNNPKVRRALHACGITVPNG